MAVIDGPDIDLESMDAWGKNGKLAGVCCLLVRS